MSEFLNNPNKVLPISLDINDALHPQVLSVVEKIVPWFPVDFTETQITGGITNILFLLSSPNCEKKLILRLYGLGTSSFIDRDVENLVFSSLSQLNFGPTFYGLFENGRIEGYLEARPITTSEMTDEEISPLIGEAQAKLHVQPVNVPVSLYGWRKIEQFVELGSRIAFKDTAKQEKLEVLRGICIAEEVNWLQRHISGLLHTAATNVTDVFSLGQLFGFYCVLAHHDLLSGNILLSHHARKVFLIDYEYSGMDYCAWDIANHFCGD